MKRRDLIRRLENDGCLLIRHGAQRDWYQNLKQEPVNLSPRYREIEEPLAKHILNMLEG